jgi:hypothetical protein
MSYAKRYNNGKLRFSLLPTKPLEHIVDVYTRGAHKYTVYEDEEGNKILGKDISVQEAAERKLKVVDDGSDNWRKGQPWLTSLESVERHISSFKSGHDFDEIGTYHLANAAWGLIALLEYYHTKPELDNRNHSYLNHKRIGLDIDEVICDFVGGLMKWFPCEMSARPVYWNDPQLAELFERVKDDETFWACLKPKVKEPLPFEPVCYVTKRPEKTHEVTERWLNLHGFPKAPVVTVPGNQSKVEAVKAHNVDIYVDDRFEYFVELNKAGVCCYLMDAPHNQRYNVGYRRIKDLKELVN